MANYTITVNKKDILRGKKHISTDFFSIKKKQFIMPKEIVSFDRIIYGQNCAYPIPTSVCLGKLLLP